MSIRTLIVPVNSASVWSPLSRPTQCGGCVQCLVRWNLRTAIKQDVFLSFQRFYLGLLYIVGGFGKRRVSEINGQNQHASRINEHLSASALPKRNIVPRCNFDSIPCWTSFTAIFPLASSLDTASGINGQQQHPSRTGASCFSSGRGRLFRHAAAQRRLWL